MNEVEGIWRKEEIGKGFLVSSVGKVSAYNVGDLASIPGLVRSSGEGIGYPLQYPCMENPYGQRSLAGCSPWCSRVGHH